MGKPSRATQAKRNRERALQELQREKRAKRALRGDSKLEREKLIADGIDPDLHGIEPGPQKREEDE